MTAMNNERNPLVIPFQVGTQNADVTLPCIRIPRKFKITAVRLINGATLAEHADNHVKVSLKRGSTVVAEWSTVATTGNGGFTANVARALTVAEALQSAGAQLTVVVDATGTVTTTNMLMQIEGFNV